MSQSIGEIIQLIETLYSPTPPANINEIQQHLQSIQKNEKIGIELAKTLLRLDSKLSAQCKYFGALTYTVQINHYLSKFSNSENAILDDERPYSSNGSPPPDDDVPVFLKTLLIDNMSFLIQYSSFYIKGECEELFLVIRKLMSNLSVLFININKDLIDLIVPPGGSKNSAGWKNPINSLIYALLHIPDGNISLINDSVMLNIINETISYDKLIEFISFSKYSNKLLITFLSILVEEIMKTSSTRILPFQLTNVYHIIHDNVYITGLSIFMENLQQRIVCTTPGGGAAAASELHKMAYTDELLFESLTSWFQYSQTIPQVSGQSIDLTELFVKLMELMCNDNVDFKYSSEIVNIFYHLHDVNSLVVLNYEIRSRLEKLIFPTAPVTIDNSYLSSSSPLLRNSNWIMEYMNYLVTNELYENELKNLALLMPNVLSNSMTKTCNNFFLRENRGNQQIQEHVQLLLQYTNFPLVPITQENFSIQMLNFWCDLAEVFASLDDRSSEGNTLYDHEFAISLFQQCVEIYIPKLSLHNKEKVLEEANDTGETQLILEFDDFRKIGTEFIDQIWSILGHTHLTSKLMELSLNNNNDIYQLEVCSMLLQQLCEGTNFQQSPMLSDALEQEDSKIINQNIKMLEVGLTHPVLKNDFIKTATRFLATVASYFNISDNKKPVLNHCIDVLFKTLSDSAKNNQETEFMICKTLTTLCETCRFQLNSYLDSFMDILQTMLQPSDPSNAATNVTSNGIKISALTREKFSGSCGSIVTSFDKHAIKDTTNFPHLAELQKAYINKFLDIVSECIGKSPSCFTMEQDLSDYVLSLLKCIHSFNEGLLIFNDDEDFDGNGPHISTTLTSFSYSAPSTTAGNLNIDSASTTIDLSNDGENNGGNENGDGDGDDDDDDDYGSNGISSTNPMVFHYQQFMIQYWSIPENYSLLVQKLLHILNDLVFVNLASVSVNNSKIIEQANMIMSQYFSANLEQQPFPFKFEITEVMGYISNKFSACPFAKCFESNLTVLKKLVQYMNKLKMIGKDEFDYIFNNFVVKYYFVEGGILSDPDYIQTCIEFVNNILETSPRLIIQSAYFESFLVPEFLKLLLLVREKFTIIPLCKFWIKLLNNKKYDQDCVVYVNGLFNSPSPDCLGYRLVKNCFLIILNSNRSEVMQYSDVIRTLVSKHPLYCKKWLQMCLLEDQDLSQLLHRQTNTTSSGINHAKFIEKLMITSGSKRACIVINDWYLQCNGLPHY